MKEVDMAMLVDGVAKVISGAPFPSKQSLSKARKAVEFVLAAPALDLPSLAERDQLRAEKKEFAAEAVKWSREVGHLKAEKEHYLGEALRWSTEAVRLQALLHDAQRDAERYRWICDGHGYAMEEEGLCHRVNEKHLADQMIDAAIAAEREVLNG